MTAVRKTTTQTYTVEFEDEMAEAMKKAAAASGHSVESFIVSAAHAFFDNDLGVQHWTAEDIAAIDEGFAQIDRGEVFTQEEVEAEIDALLR